MGVSKAVRSANVWKRFVKDDTLGIHFAANVFVATIALWLMLRTGANPNPSGPLPR